jgi:hypothetical protein
MEPGPGTAECVDGRRPGCKAVWTSGLKMEAVCSSETLVSAYKFVVAILTSYFCGVKIREEDVGWACRMRVRLNQCTERPRAAVSGGVPKWRRIRCQPVVCLV